MTIDQRDLDFLRSIGKCASIAPKYMGQFICTLSANHRDRNHLAQILGGPDDGQILAEWPW